jgi:hypothetical protein
MKTPLGVALAITLVLALVALVHPSAWADWHVSSVTYTDGYDAEVDEAVLWPGTQIVAGHRERRGGEGWYYARAEAYGIGLTRHVSVTTDPTPGQGQGVGYSNLHARLNLAGSAPPPRPSVWLQKSYLNGSHCIDFCEVETVAGTCSMAGVSKTGLMGHNPPTQGHWFSKTWDSEEPHDVHEHYEESYALEEPDWVSRTTLNEYLAAWVYSRAIARACGTEGIVRCKVNTCGTP